ncbi:hypothetical protein LX36DRAFT_124329 [Colletotrichum falcatum]|nr:hypothetical protein LX36DRAFT_124329 [Colletotrichum falcatum]
MADGMMRARQHGRRRVVRLRCGGCQSASRRASLVWAARHRRWDRPTPRGLPTVDRLPRRGTRRGKTAVHRAAQARRGLAIAVTPSRRRSVGLKTGGQGRTAEDEDEDEVERCYWWVVSVLRLVAWADQLRGACQEAARELYTTYYYYMSCDGHKHCCRRDSMRGWRGGRTAA